VSAGARGGVVACGTELQAGRSRVRSPMVSLEFFIDLFFPAGSTKPLTDLNTMNISWGVKVYGA